MGQGNPCSSRRIWLLLGKWNKGAIVLASLKTIKPRLDSFRREVAARRCVSKSPRRSGDNLWKERGVVALCKCISTAKIHEFRCGLPAFGETAAMHILKTPERLRTLGGRLLVTRLAVMPGPIRQFWSSCFAMRTVITTERDFLHYFCRANHVALNRVSLRVILAP